MISPLLLTGGWGGGGRGFAFAHILCLRGCQVRKRWSAKVTASGEQDHGSIEIAAVTRGTEQTIPSHRLPLPLDLCITT
jgi:hypothetical protein